ncbi:MAG: DNA polymerase III subunit gamma/tau [Candidatus Izemoplasmatales bacterium]|nr:DNA polymerase III subunit gamma/tau [Candidatus Izemoplasmatales bacterium]MDD4069126.1 DNA polymerase III subunit gamma/tau [Candidatus Izemoplasmatales bacterium]
MSYKALYRTYRPKDFNEVAGQKHITQTLKNALANDKVAHAYLFSGPRGTGKTSIAKILAKAVNCVNAPTENPCNVCENCKGIQDGTISDVIEIDAASNNGVDEIRELRDKVKYLPGYVKYKVYIIDEVHMLSQGAFNALLKTLEEPPAHVIFILCTTELQKVIPTIQSRCQRFDFKAISVLDIILKLKEIIASENIQIEEDAIKQIATYAEGGLRDAISLLDQVYAYNPDSVTLEDVNHICGAVSMQTQIDLAKALIDFDSTKAIDLLNNLLSQGKEVKKITLNLIEFFRDVLMFKNIKTLDESSLLYGHKEFEEIANEISNRKAFYIIDVLNNALNEINWSNNPKIHLELAFLKVADNEENSNSNVLAAIDEIEIRLLELENFKNFVEAEDKKESKQIIQNIISKTSRIEETDENIIKAAVEKIKDRIFTTPEIEGNEVKPNETKENTNIELDVFEGQESIDFKEDISNHEKHEIEEAKGKPQPNIIENNFNQQEDILVNNPDTIKEELCKDISNTYDINFVEEVLNNGDRKDKLFLLEKWQNFPDIEGEEDSKYLASLLETGTVVASSYDKIVITFSSATICNTLMIPTNKEIVMKIINKKYNRIINYMALPSSVFSDISKEFLQRYRKGEKYIKLSKIVCEGLQDVSKIEKTHNSDSNPKIVQDAIDLFGDKVVIKE